MVFLEECLEFVFSFSSGFSPQVSEGDFQDSWIICSEGLGIGFVSSAERPRHRWSDGIVCYRSYFVEAVHLRVLLSTPDIGLKAVSLSVWRLQSFVNLPASPGIEVFVGQCRLNNIISDYNTKLLTKHEKYCNILCGIYIEIPTFSSNAIFISQ